MLTDSQRRQIPHLLNLVSGELEVHPSFLVEAMQTYPVCANVVLDWVHGFASKTEVIGTFAEVF
jgi:hypothetical protein